MSFITTKFHETLLSGFRGVALTRKTGLTDRLTDRRTGHKHYTLLTSLRGYKYLFFKFHETLDRVIGLTNVKLKWNLLLIYKKKSFTPFDGCML